MEENQYYWPLSVDNYVNYIIVLIITIYIYIYIYFISLEYEGSMIQALK